MCIMRVDEEMKHGILYVFIWNIGCIVSHLTAANVNGCNAKSNGWNMKKKGENEQEHTIFDLNSS